MMPSMAIDRSRLYSRAYTCLLAIASMSEKPCGAFANCLMHFLLLTGIGQPILSEGVLAAAHGDPAFAGIRTGNSPVRSVCTSKMLT